MQVIPPNPALIEASLLEAFQSSPIGMALLDLQGRFLRVNPTYCSMLGRTQEDMLSLSFMEITHPDDLKESQQSVQNLIQGRTTHFHQEKRYLHASGREIWGEVHVSLVKDGSGQPVNFMAQILDITQRKQSERAMQESNELLSLFLHHSPIYAFIKEVTPTRSLVLHASENYQDMIGIPGSQMVGKTMEELFPLEFAQKITADDWAVAESKTILKLDEDLNGRHYTTIKFPIVQGDRTLLAGYTIDITDRKRAEERFFKVFHENPVSMALSRPRDRAMLDVNRAWSELTGWSKEQALATLLDGTDLVTDSDPWTAMFQILEQSGRLRAFPLKIRRKSGEIRDILMSAETLELNGEACVISSGQDVTELRRMELALQQSENWHRTILETALDGFFVVDSQGRIQQINQAYSQMSGYSIEELLKMKVQDLESEETAEQTALHIQKVFSEGRHRFESKHRRKDGSTWDVEVSVQVLEGSNGCLVAFLRDITARKASDEAFRRNHARLMEAQAMAHLGDWELDHTSGQLSWSDEIFRIFEMDPACFGASYEAFLTSIHPEDREKVDQAFWDSLAQRKPYNMTHRLLTSNGKLKYVQERCQTTYDPEGHPLRSVGTVQDITARVTAEETVRKQAEELDIFFRTNLDLLCLANTEGRFLRLNPEWERTLGYPLQELEGAPFMEYVHPEDHQATLEAVTQLTSQNEVQGFVNRYRCKDGSYRWIEWRSAPKGDLIFAAARDITQHKQAEDALRESEARVRTKLNAILSPEGDLSLLELSDILDVKAIQDLMDRFYALTQMGIGIIDLKGRILVSTGWQDACVHYHRSHPESCRNCLESDLELSAGLAEGQCKIYKCKNHMWDMVTPIVIGGRHVGNLFLGQFFFEGEVPDRELFRAQAAHFGFDADSYLEAIERVPRWSRKTVQLVMDFYTHLSNMLSTLSYTTLKLARTLEERQRMATEQEILQSQLLQSQKMESVGRLAGGVAHDFNNMLSVILGLSEMALESVQPKDKLHGFLKEIHKAAHRSAELTGQLLAFARKQTIAPKILDLNLTIESMLKMLRHLLGEDIELHWIAAPGLWKVRMDPSQIDQILANLCVNARGAISGHGIISIETSNLAWDPSNQENVLYTPKADYVRLRVSDTGCGMDAETLSQIFEPFFTTKGLGMGTGLGLATVYGIVKQNNGLITVQSEPGKGTTFLIDLPRHHPTAEEESSERASSTLQLGHETVLLVEDEPAILEMTRMMLERLGYSVLAASKPQDALRMAEKHPERIHLLMTDVVMPEMNGRDLAHRLIGIQPGLVRLFMSGYTADVIAPQGVLEPDVHFIQKPFSIKELSAKLRLILGNPTSSSSPLE